MKLMSQVYYVGVQDRKLEVFDVIMRTPFGTTYNAYILKGSNKIALVETCKIDFFDECLTNIKEVCGDKAIDYCIMNHTEPDHAGSLNKLLEVYPDMQIVASGVALGFIKEIINRPFSSITAKEGMVLDLGDLTCEFYSAPNLHWPDTMYTYVKEKALLFTCDSFGAHYSFDGVLKSEVVNKDDYQKAVKLYFDDIIAPFRKVFMVKAIQKIEPLTIDMIATGHGPVIDVGIKEAIEQAKAWSILASDKKLITIPYVSAYGYTEMLAKKIAEGILQDSDFRVILHDCVNGVTEEIRNDIMASDGILLGSPTILADALPPIWHCAGCLNMVVHRTKFGGAFGSYGWSGEAVDFLSERMRQVKMNVVDGFKVKFKPSDDDLSRAVEFGVEFSKKVKG